MEQRLGFLSFFLTHLHPPSGAQVEQSVLQRWPCPQGSSRGMWAWYDRPALYCQPPLGPCPVLAALSTRRRHALFVILVKLLSKILALTPKNRLPSAADAGRRRSRSCRSGGSSSPPANPHPLRPPFSGKQPCRDTLASPGVQGSPSSLQSPTTTPKHSHWHRGQGIILSHNN